MAASHFPVSWSSEQKQAVCYWATPADADIDALKLWSGGASVRGQDAAELARLAAMKWEIAGEVGVVASSLAEMNEAIHADASAEVTGMLLAAATWFDAALLGVCLFHRTWAGNVFLDFLAVHPEATGVRGVGTGLLHELCEVSQALHAGLIWGETTPSSASFYARAFGTGKVNDQLLITTEQQAAFCQDVEALWGTSP